MPPERPHLSITLPRNFQFHYTDGQLPKTPEPRENRETTVEPPKLPRQTYRLRRRRAPLPSYDINLDPEDVPIPSIETTAAPAASSNVQSNEPVEGYLQPEPVNTRFRTPPRTPVAQMAPRTNSSEKINDRADYDAMSPGEISRPSSACSGFSDSSSYSNLSFGGSCTSPESECNDPFTNLKSQPLVSPFSIVSSDPPRGVKRKTPKPVFTEDMDRHLWICYMQYLQDPTVTPFKMLPGVAPPLGVCVRVARLARKTWKGPRLSVQPRGTKRSFGSPATVKPSKSGSTTPTNNSASKPYLSWPRENAPTRKRLRELIKRKPTLSAHYARLVNCRTPSPFPSSPQQASQHTSHGLMSSMAQNSSFSTRDMNISLAASTSSTMQYGNPLMNMAHDRNSNNVSNDEWFGQPLTRPVQHQKSQSLHFGSRAGPHATPALRSLRSPFHERPQYPSNRSRSPYGQRDDLHAPLPLPRSFKRRALYRMDDSDAQTENNPVYRESLLQELFGAPAETSHRRIRSRGFSLGDMGDGVRGLTSMFTPPQPEQVEPVAPALSRTPPATQQSTQHFFAQLQPTRLGSPFGGRSSNVHFNNTFPRNFTPHSFEPSVSFEARLGDMN